MKKYKSKIDNIFIILTIVPIVFSLIFFLNKVGGLIPSLVMILVGIFILSILFSTYYKIIDGMLIIKSSFIVSLNIEIKSIKKIEKSRSWEKAPANSMDRIEIKYDEKPAVRYNFYDSVIISPENKEEFIAALLEVNPTIEVNL